MEVTSFLLRFVDVEDGVLTITAKPCSFVPLPEPATVILG